MTSYLYQPWLYKGIKKQDTNVGPGYNNEEKERNSNFKRRSRKSFCIWLENVEKTDIVCISLSIYLHVPKVGGKLHKSYVYINTLATLIQDKAYTYTQMQTAITYSIILFIDEVSNLSCKTIHRLTRPANETTGQ